MDGTVGMGLFSRLFSRKRQMANPERVLRHGATILKPIFDPSGFKFRKESSGRSSGGAYASGAFVKGNRRFEFHVRDSLGLVTYRVGGTQLSHTDYMTQLGVKHLYPTFGEEFQSQFEALAHDVVTFAQDFLQGDGAEFKRLAEDLAAHPNKFKGLPS
ncbi:MAG TPA: hypothetical protein VN577_02425 [Terriglobales bacterium]|nr:hypothetical protein [Terriglobales bacterium]